MKRTSLGLILASVACGASATFMSCDNGGTNPANPPSAYESGKGAHTLTDECVDVFAGVQNCALGGASISDDGGTVTVSNLGSLADGVSGSFPDAAAWSQDLSVNFGGVDGSLRYSASSQGQILGQLLITHGADGANSATALYTGEEGGPSAYSVHVFNNGALVGGQTGIPGSGGGPTIFNGIISHAGFGNISNDGPYTPIPYPVPEPGDPDPWQDGACQWTLESAGTFSVTLPDGTVLNGDKIAFTEQVTAGHTVYSRFQRVDVQGAMASYTITGESSTAAGE